MLVNGIRILSVVVIRNDGHILACPGFDNIKGTNFYRLIGGGVEFNEDSLTALKREIREELDLELENYRLLSVLENIFVYNGNSGHEICFVYEAEFKDKANYERKSFEILDGDKAFDAIWVEMTEENKKKVFPGGASDLL